jgi:hypothetical protein
MRVQLGLVLVVLGGTPVMAQQVCDTKDYPLSAPTTRFVDNGDGTVTDSATHMMWMRCSIGQTWTGSTCDGVATPLTWQAAVDAADALDKQGGYAKHADWRLPRITELAAIAERQCSNPRTNLAVFPKTPATFYWTASNRHGHGNENQAFMLSFGPEGTGGGVKDEKHPARLVRASP